MKSPKRSYLVPTYLLQTVPHLLILVLLMLFFAGTVIQGFISPGRIQKYLPKMM